MPGWIGRSGCRDIVTGAPGSRIGIWSVLIEKRATRQRNYLLCLRMVVVMVMMMVVVSMSIRPLRLRRIRDCEAEDECQSKQILLHSRLDTCERRKVAPVAGLFVLRAILTYRGSYRCCREFQGGQATARVRRPTESSAAVTLISML